MTIKRGNILLPCRLMGDNVSAGCVVLGQALQPTLLKSDLDAPFSATRQPFHNLPQVIHRFIHRKNQSLVGRTPTKNKATPLQGYSQSGYYCYFLKILNTVTAVRGVNNFSVTRKACSDKALDKKQSCGKPVKTVDKSLKILLLLCFVLGNLSGQLKAEAVENVVVQYSEAYFEKLVGAIYEAEGGVKTNHPFGILSVKCDGYRECRMVCMNTVRNNYTRWLKTDRQKPYLVFLRDRYCPVQAHKLNKNWLKNVKYFLNK